MLGGGERRGLGGDGVDYLGDALVGEAVQVEGVPDVAAEQELGGQDRLVHVAARGPSAPSVMLPPVTGVVGDDAAPRLAMSYDVRTYSMYTGNRFFSLRTFDRRVGNSCREVQGDPSGPRLHFSD